MKIQKTFIIKPTMNCNLRCKYCYEFNKNGNLYNNSFLSIDSLLDFMKKVAQLFDDSRVLWLLHGGEPVLCGTKYLEAFIDCMRFVRKTYGVDFQFALQTNATLLTKDYVQILEDNIDLLSERIVSVSIDGSKVINDLVRISTNNQGSFDKIMEGLSLIQKSKLKFSTITVIGEHNVKYPEQVYNFTRSLDSSLCKYIPCYNFDESGNCEKFGINPIDYSYFMCSIFDLWVKDLPKQPNSDFLIIDPIATILSKLSKTFVTWCEYRKEKCDNFICLYPDGELWLCDSMNHNTMKDIGCLGNIHSMSSSDLKTAISNPCQVSNFCNFYDNLTSKCLSCDIYSLCMGGCLPIRDIIRNKSNRLFNDYCTAKHILFSYIERAYNYALSKS